MGRMTYEAAPEYVADGYAVDGWRGIAFYVLGWETQADDDTEWTGIRERTGNLVVCMVGDDRHWSVEPEDVHEIPADDYCHECGQVGCHGDAR